MNIENMSLITEYFDSGEIQCQYYVNSAMQKNGSLKRWFKNGKIFCESNYLNNLAHGKYQEWSEGGNLRIVAEYKKGQRNGVHKSWFNRGNIKEYGYYINDVAQLGYKWYKPNGELWCILDEAYLEKIKDQ
ncbi:toxin-antitoxin system YwqK family antitoxin [Acinetobacter defluvii]|uniref:toxin-antitoxin system YwqK family antitoxin n=1 Tax=Acinetobacter defluvii TaxID=1871111 RepID=UPI003AF6592D